MINPEEKSEEKTAKGCAIETKAHEVTEKIGESESINQEGAAFRARVLQLATRTFMVRHYLHSFT